MIRTAPFSPEHESFLKKAEDFLGQRLSFEPRLFIVDTREEFNALTGKDTQDWVVAFAKNHSVIIFSPESIEQETTHKRDQWDELVRHENGPPGLPRALWHV